jgi:GNAT superfamily N-acetyltransferase
MGGGQPLADSVQATLCDRLAQVPLAISFIAWQGDEAVGLVNCFEGFSTFKAQPLLNVHDLVVRAGQRGRGVGQALLAAAQAHARQQGCCKLTLEVLSSNARALRSYEQFGFAPYAGPGAGARADDAEVALTEVAPMQNGHFDQDTPPCPNSSTPPAGQCLFCKLIAGQIPSVRVFEDELTLAFMDLGQVNPGHVLVASKRHARTLLDLTPDEAAAVMQTARAWRWPRRRRSSRRASHCCRPTAPWPARPWGTSTSTCCRATRAMASTWPGRARSPGRPPQQYAEQLKAALT